MNVFYSSSIKSGICILNKEESLHCTKVLRLGKNDNIILVDGSGGYYKANIIIADPKKCTVSITESIKEFEKRNYYCHIGISPTKSSDRLEWFIEKATEIGVDEITPIKCERSERKKIRNDRLEKVIISAIKQSVKAYKPKLNEMKSFEELISNSRASQKFIAHYENKSANLLSNKYNPPSDILILIGPEGDFSPSEKENAHKNGFESISLGNSRLRTETAGVVAVHTVSILNCCF